jgi:limonene-1,2-epoxide hydrolase
MTSTDLPIRARRPRAPRRPRRERPTVPLIRVLLEGGEMSRTDAEELVDRFLGTWERGDVEEMLAFFAEDAVYHNMPMEPAVGTDAVRVVLAEFMGGMDGLRAEVHTQLAAGNVVMHERTDHFSVNGAVMTLPICGVFEIEAGRIKSWREYFDMSRFLTP